MLRYSYIINITEIYVFLNSAIRKIFASMISHCFGYVLICVSKLSTDLFNDIKVSHEIWNFGLLIVKLLYDSHIHICLSVGLCHCMLRIFKWLIIYIHSLKTGIRGVIPLESGKKTFIYYLIAKNLFFICMAK